ncbi:hypothetical protein BHM03_00032292 [Ensete ventricosum]|nr:hypothetical protein BHM03_00032292 [Ensete ventricosum]
MLAWLRSWCGTGQAQQDGWSPRSLDLRGLPLIEEMNRHRRQRAGVEPLIISPRRQIGVRRTLACNHLPFFPILQRWALEPGIQLTYKPILLQLSIAVVPSFNEQRNSKRVDLEQEKVGLIDFPLVSKKSYKSFYLARCGIKGLSTFPLIFVSLPRILTSVGQMAQIQPIMDFS